LATSTAAAEDQKVFVFGKFAVSCLNLLQGNIQRSVDSSLGDFLWGADIDKNRLGFFGLAHFDRFFPGNGGIGVWGSVICKSKTCEKGNGEKNPCEVFHCISIERILL